MGKVADFYGFVENQLGDLIVSEITDPTVGAKQPPEPSKPGRGRKPGMTLRYTKDSVKRLEELGFDPIEKLVNLYNDITTEINDLVALKACPRVLPNGDIRRYSSMAHASLLTTQQKLVNDLMRYGYARVPETLNIKPAELPPMVIGLTKDLSDFDPDRVIDVVAERLPQPQPEDDEDD